MAYFFNILGKVMTLGTPRNLTLNYPLCHPPFLIGMQCRLSLDGTAGAAVDMGIRQFGRVV